MSVEELMEKHGFQLVASCSGQAAYTKFVTHNEKRAYVNVTEPNGQGLPASLDDPVRVIIYNLKSGDEVAPGRDCDSLKQYLESAPAD